MRILSYALASALLTACVSLPREPNNPHVLQRPWGVATAESVSGAHALAASVERARVALRALPEFHDRSLRAHLSSGALYRRTSALTVERFGRPLWIQAAEHEGEPLDNAIAHELVHYHFSEFLRYFPQLVEEGVAEMLAGLVAPEPSDQELKLTAASAAFLNDYRIIIQGDEVKELVARLVANTLGVEEALTLSSSEFIDMDATVRLALYGLGRVIAERIGYPGLVELVRQARAAGLDRVPHDRILGAAGMLPPTQDNLRVAFIDVWGSAENEASLSLTLRFSTTTE